MRCGGSNTCACAVHAGDGIDVTGAGTPGSPYVISADGTASTALAVADTDTVVLGLTGTGAGGDPYTVTGDVPDGTVIPATNPTLDLVGAKAGAGLDYDPGTRETSVLISADADNAAALGTDEGLYVGPPDVDPADLISGDADNALGLGTDPGLYVPVPAAQAVDTTTVNTTVTGAGTPASPFLISSVVNSGTVTPATNPTLDLVGARVDAPLTYNAGTRRFGVSGGADVVSTFMTAEIVSIDPLLVMVSDGASIVPAILPPWLTYMVPWPYVGQNCHVLAAGPNSGADPTAVLIVGFALPYPGWVRGIVAATSPLTVLVYGGGAVPPWLTSPFPAETMPTYTPVVDDDVILLMPNGATDNHFMILGAAA